MQLAQHQLTLLHVLQGNAGPHSRNSNGHHTPSRHAEAAAALQHSNSRNGERSQLPASSSQVTAAAAAAAVSQSTSTGSKKRRASSQQAASSAVGREDAATWAAAVGRVRRTWPGFGQQLEAQLAKVRISTRPDGALGSRPHQRHSPLAHWAPWCAARLSSKYGACTCCSRLS
jgi:hypothetical protein